MLMQFYAVIPLICFFRRKSHKRAGIGYLTMTFDLES